MAFAKGKSGNPNGRPKGTRSRTTQLKEAALLKILAKHKAPLDFLLELMSSGEAPLAVRIDAAKAAAPYVHRRMPIAIENSDQGPFRVFDMAKLSGMTKKDLEQLRTLVSKAQPDAGT